MTSLVPREPYSEAELSELYPQGLTLELVQILLRHGERSPVSARFQNVSFSFSATTPLTPQLQAGLAPYWPYCNAAQRMRSVVMMPTETSQWDSLQWRRRLERFGEDDSPVIAAGPNGEVDGVCNLGELTDKGRETTYALGERLRQLYVDRLKFMPSMIGSADMIYLRATPMPRALESVQQAFWGMYPLTARTASFPPPTIVTRTPADEILFPNEGHCRRFAQLSSAFAQRTADRWNDSDDMKYLNKLISKWMPASSPKVAVDSPPRLTGIMDTINATLAHGPETRLPSEFYDPKGREIIDKVGVQEWFSGYNESREYRTLGIGALVGNVVECMVAAVEGTGLSVNEVGGENGALGVGRRGEKRVQFSLAGCHDTTLAGFMTSFGAFKDEKWPPYTSHIAVELFRNPDEAPPPPPDEAGPKSATTKQAEATRPGLFASLLGLSPSKAVTAPSTISSNSIARRPTPGLSPAERQKMHGYYVRLRFNDKVKAVPGCAKPGKNFNGDATMCTLEAFKAIADDFTPRNWKVECRRNMGEKKLPVVGQEEWAGFEPGEGRE
jgi:acid phosphatase